MIERIEAPALGRSCRMTVTIPAKDEADNIAASLAAFAGQSGRRDFDVIVLANNCTDRTANRARAAARRYTHVAIHVVETTLPPQVAHVGHARKLLMDCAAQRFLRASDTGGIIASTDADTIVAHDWVERTFEEMQSADAVAGFVIVGRADRRAMPAPVRSLYERETAFRRAWTDIESLIDPRPEDPPPRHGAFVGASFAVSVAAYMQAGGLPRVACLEDREFLFALRRVDARIRFSRKVRAYTSGRRVGRVPGGFGTFIGHLYKQGQAYQSLLVQDPRQIIAELEGRAAIRRIWLGESSADDLTRVSEIFAVTPASCVTLVERSLPFGTAYERFVTTTGRRRSTYEMVSVDEAIEVLSAAAAERNAATPTRCSAASGAG